MASLRCHEFIFPSLVYQLSILELNAVIPEKVFSNVQFSARSIYVDIGYIIIILTQVSSGLFPLLSSGTCNYIASPVIVILGN